MNKNKEDFKQYFKQYCKSKGVRCYEVSHYKGKSESWLVRLLRFSDEIPKESREELIHIVDVLATKEGR